MLLYGLLMLEPHLLVICSTQRSVKCTILSRHAIRAVRLRCSISYVIKMTDGQPLETSMILWSLNKTNELNNDTVGRFNMTSLVNRACDVLSIERVCVRLCFFPALRHDVMGRSFCTHRVLCICIHQRPLCTMYLNINMFICSCMFVADTLHNNFPIMCIHADVLISIYVCVCDMCMNAALHCMYIKQ